MTRAEVLARISDVLACIAYGAEMARERSFEVPPEMAT